MISRTIRGIVSFFHRLWNIAGLIGLLSVVATIPILQLASFGYMLETAGRISRGRPLRECFPGTRTAGLILTCFLGIGVSWLPVWFVAELAYSAELIEPGSAGARSTRMFARVLSVIWIAWVAWAVFRGGRLVHFLWPAPVRMVRTLLRRSTWFEAEDRLWNFVSSLHVIHLMRLGFFGTVGALAWLSIPASLIVIGLSSNGGPGVGLIGLLGAIAMWWVLLHLPFLQVQLARENRLMAVFDLRSVRRSFKRAPWAFCLSTWCLILLAMPLYLFRIESIPQQLWWILSFFFVLLMFPPKLITGWALRRAMFRPREVAWYWRWMAWIPQFAVISVYLGSLYLAKFALWEGAASIFLQHAFLPPVPFYLR